MNNNIKKKTWLLWSAVDLTKPSGGKTVFDRPNRKICGTASANISILFVFVYF
jgi:hypothetical protein